jgi:hypothetical protein
MLPQIIRSVNQHAARAGGRVVYRVTGMGFENPDKCVNDLPPQVPTDHRASSNRVSGSRNHPNEVDGVAECLTQTARRAQTC